MQFRAPNKNPDIHAQAIARAVLLAIVVAGFGGQTLHAGQSDVCSDAVFLRRASVVLNGRTPGKELIAGFLDGSRSLDRPKLVDALLARAEFGRAWGRWLARLTGCEEIPLSTASFAMKVPRERIFWLWQTWTQDRLNEDKPYSEIISELIRAESRSPGESYEQYATRYRGLVESLNDDFAHRGLMCLGDNDLFWKTNRDPEQNAEFIARNLLGYRLECAKCHDHPFTHWTTDDHASFSAVFQRAVYAELPVRRTSKRWMIFGFGAAGLASAIMLFLFSVPLTRSGWIRLGFAANALSALVVSASLFAIANFRHLLLDGTAGRTELVAVKLASFAEHNLLLPIVALMLCLLALRRIWQSFAKNAGERSATKRLTHHAVTVVVGVVSFLFVDVAYVIASRSQSEGRSIVSLAKHQVMSVLTPDDQAPYVREVYDDTNGNYVRLGNPKPVDGPEFRDTAEHRPRLQFAEWLISEPRRQLQRNFVNRVAQRVYGQAFVTPVDDFRPDSEIVDSQFFDELVEGFVANDHSVKWLLKTMVLSDGFQVAGNVERATLSFHPRALRGEELIASLNQLSRHKIRLSEKWSPVPDDPFSCGTELPNRGALADRILNAAQCSDSHLNLPFEVVSILLMDQRFHEHIEHVASELNLRGTSGESTLIDVTEQLWGQRPTDAQLDLLFRTSDAEDVNPVWAVINSPQFLILE